MYILHYNPFRVFIDIAMFLCKSIKTLLIEDYVSQSPRLPFRLLHSQHCQASSCTMST